jgi:mannose-6-phosphate isomerase-like protein (cupin superfamily)
MRLLTASSTQRAGFAARLRRSPRRLAGLSVIATTGVVLVASPGRAQGPATQSQGTPSFQAKAARTDSVRAEALPSKVDYVPQGRYDELRKFVVLTGARGGTLFNSPDGQTNYMMELRTVASDVEEHSRWDDLIIVRSGSGSVEVGPRTKGGRFMSAGELRGGTIVAPSRLELRVGDIARIPAGIPHAFVPNGPGPWEFLLVKVRRPNKPLKRPPGTSR